MNNKSIFGGIIAVLIVAALLLPASNAFSVSVTVNPQTNEATINAYVNSSMKMTINGSKTMVNSMENSFNSTFSNMASMHINNATPAATTFGDFNHTIGSSTQGASVKNMTLSFAVSATNSSTSTSGIFYVNFSLKMHMVIHGIFSNNSANMSWRNFTMSKPINVGGTNVNHAGYNQTNTSVMNFSKFSKPLTQWNRTYNHTANETMFVYNAGVVLSLNNKTSINYPGGHGGFNMTMNLTIDPSYAIVYPGNATAGTNSISLSSSSTTPSTTSINPYYYLVAIILIAGIGVSVYFARRKH
ncbi:MAG: hypothetical protein M1476_05000 [Candidatus Thermoplasmatota archaeon]|nr:hypothetical protein [Candidatus Thermoplasmatota archaeon]